MPRMVVGGRANLGCDLTPGPDRRLEPGGADLTVVGPHRHMTFQRLLPTVSAGSVKVRGAMGPLGSHLHRTGIITGEVLSIDPRNTMSALSPNDNFALTIDPPADCRRRRPGRRAGARRGSSRRHPSRPLAAFNRASVPRRRLDEIGAPWGTTFGTAGSRHAGR